MNKYVPFLAAFALLFGVLAVAASDAIAQTADVEIVRQCTGLSCSYVLPIEDAFSTTWQVYKNCELTEFNELQGACSIIEKSVQHSLGVASYQYIFEKSGSYVVEVRVDYREQTEYDLYYHASSDVLAPQGLTFLGGRNLPLMESIIAALLGALTLILNHYFGAGV